jgi:methionine-S-sulfoxide reductase
MKSKLFIFFFAIILPLQGVAMQKKAYFAAGCFWGVEFYFQKLEAVISVESGYMGGNTQNPTYHDVLSKTTGHFESVEVVYDDTKISYEALVQYFFEIHDFTQTNGQGPDIGPQYLSAIFYKTNNEREVAKHIMTELENMGYNVATKLLEYKPFYKAEQYHQNYYQNKGTLPYCHTYKKIF